MSRVFAWAFYYSVRREKWDLGHYNYRDTPAPCATGNFSVALNILLGP